MYRVSDNNKRCTPTMTLNRFSFILYRQPAHVRTMMFRVELNLQNKWKKICESHSCATSFNGQLTQSYQFSLIQQDFSTWHHVKDARCTVFKTCHRRTSHVETKSLAAIMLMQKQTVRCSISAWKLPELEWVTAWFCFTYISFLFFIWSGCGAFTSYSRRLTREWRLYLKRK